jgi:ABC-type oligopeptide transport system ATPase subunit
VETNTDEYSYTDPQHDYTKTLLAAMLTVEPVGDEPAAAHAVTTSRKG